MDHLSVQTIRQTWVIGADKDSDSTLKILEHNIQYPVVVAVVVAVVVVVVVVVVAVVVEFHLGILSHFKSNP